MNYPLVIAIDVLGSQSFNELTNTSTSRLAICPSVSNRGLNIATSSPTHRRVAIAVRKVVVSSDQVKPSSIR